ncbi:hypothetical protein [Paracoccus cavernae]
MKWQQVQDNWSAFFDAISEKWPDVDENELEEIDGDQRAFIAYIAEVTEQDPREARDEIREWLSGEIPSDVVMDPSHNDRSMAFSSKFVPEGEDESDDDALFGDDDYDNEDND